MLALKKLLVIAMILITLVSGSRPVYAAGIPIYQYTQNVGYVSGSFYIGVSPYNTWAESRYVDYGEWGYYETKYYYFKWSSSSYVNSDYYITKITGRAFYAWAGANDNGTVYVQTSNDGINWSVPSSIASLGNNGYWVNFSTPISPAKMVKVGVLSMGTGNPNYIANTSLDISSFELSLAGADQGTAEAARTAANNASTYAQQAKTSADTAATNATNAFNAVSNANGNTITAVRDASGTVLTEARSAKNNIPVIISGVRGLGGATCTTGTSFTAVVLITPSTGINYSVSCTGPLTPVTSVNGNNITFNGLTAAGAYSATITATNTATGSTATTLFTFFKI